MFPQRNLLRLSQRTARQATPVRSAVSRRFNSSEQNKAPWIVDNEFNRERAAVKHHAQSTSGMYLAAFGCDLECLPECTTDSMPPGLWRKLAI